MCAFKKKGEDKKLEKVEAKINCDNIPTLAMLTEENLLLQTPAKKISEVIPMTLGKAASA